MKPAARVGDMHTCPMVTPGTPPIPHVGGPVLPPGCPTVLIGGQPAARMGDMLTCVGPPDVIAFGSPTVLIGGQPAARLGDPTAHGGVIVVGCPTVLIGEVGVVTPGGGLGGGLGSPGAVGLSGSTEQGSSKRKTADALPPSVNQKNEGSLPSVTNGSGKEYIGETSDPGTPEKRRQMVEKFLWNPEQEKKLDKLRADSRQLKRIYDKNPTEENRAKLERAKENWRDEIDVLISKENSFDYSKPMSIRKVSPGKTSYQYSCTGKVGSFCSEFDADVSKLNFNPTGCKQQEITCTKETLMLVSQTPDSSNNPLVKSEFRGPGGETQYCLADCDSWKITNVASSSFPSTVSIKP